MTAREVAAELGVSERTVRRWIDKGDLHADKRGGAFEINLEAAMETFGRSRAGSVARQGTMLGELRGRYLEVCDRLERTEAALAAEQMRAWRLERVLYPHAELRVGVPPVRGGDGAA